MITSSSRVNDVLRLVGALAWLAVFIYQPRLTFAVTLLLIGSAFIVFNAMIFLGRLRGQVDGPSVAPVFGGLFAATGVALLPVEGAWHWAWIPLLLDWGGLPMFLFGTARYLWAVVSGRRHAG